MKNAPASVHVMGFIYLFKTAFALHANSFLPSPSLLLLLMIIPST